MIASAGGRITFAEFMGLALYHSEHGYYLGPTVHSAREGDFLTAAELHPIFGRVLARQLGEMWALLGRPAEFALREYGAGPGTLALAILEGLRADRSGLLAALRCELVEVNPHHRAAMQDRFTAAGFADRLAGGFEDPLAEGFGAIRPEGRSGGGPKEPSATRFVGCILANEFLDALPVHRVVGAGRLQELFVAWRDGWFAEEEGEPSTPELPAYFERVGIVLAPGQRAEVNLAMARWLDEVARDLERGYILVIDYGHPAAALYSPERIGGTLRAYREHTAHDDPFRFVGRQDLTAHVDLTTLVRWARERGLVPLATTTQARFLVASGLEELLGAERGRKELAAEAYLTLRASIVRLLDPRALGGFRVLLLGRGTPSDRLPSGFPDAATVGAAPGADADAGPHGIALA